LFDESTLDRIDVGEVALRVHTVVCPDLHGHGGPDEPAGTDDHPPYSKRRMAADVVALMVAPGHERFAVVGPDRGSYVAYRTALDHPGAGDRLVVVPWCRGAVVPWCPQIIGHGIDSGHHVAEEAPGELVAGLRDFLAVR
jgi:pimeloyl-ACP methyl ester carboxylesterase